MYAGKNDYRVITAELVSYEEQKAKETEVIDREDRA